MYSLQGMNEVFVKVREAVSLVITNCNGTVRDVAICEMRLAPSTGGAVPGQE